MLISVKSDVSDFEVVFKDTNLAFAVLGFMGRTVNTLKVKIIKMKYLEK